jgi:hypothetical protein
MRFLVGTTILFPQLMVGPSSLVAVSQDREPRIAMRAATTRPFLCCQGRRTPRAFKFLLLPSPQMLPQSRSTSALIIAIAGGSCTNSRSGAMETIICGVGRMTQSTYMSKGLKQATLTSELSITVEA